jgi:hypothetical protein
VYAGVQRLQLDRDVDFQAMPLTDLTSRHRRRGRPDDDSARRRGARPRGDRGDGTCTLAVQRLQPIATSISLCSIVQVAPGTQA